MAATDAASICVSLVCHRQAELIAGLLAHLARCPEVAQLVLTYNLPETEAPLPAELVDRTTVVRNLVPLGFAANHNAAARQSRFPFLCVLNPDIRWHDNPFPRLLRCLEHPGAAVVAPAVVNPRGEVEDNARHFPTPFGLVMKALGRSDGRYAYRLGDDVPQKPDWVAGMFLVIRSSAFAQVDGFDDRFRLYYEDVDLCLRFRRLGLDVLLCPGATVVHDARRTSHRDLRYFVWHLRSILRFFRKHLGRFPQQRTT